jgi:hypothetical protein
MRMWRGVAGRSFYGLVLVMMSSLVQGQDVPLTLERSEYPTEPRPAVVPFELLPSNHMVIEAKLNGEGPFRLIFDLGSPVILLSNRAADKSGAIGKDVPKSFLFGARGEGELALLEVGDLKARDLPVVVMDHPAVKALGEALGKPLDGIVGYTFFARYRTTLDYQQKRMTFVEITEPHEVRNLVKDLPGRMLGPKVERTRALEPSSLFGLEVGEAALGGVRVTAVHEGGPASLAGVRVGDVLISLDGRWTTTRADAYAAAAGCHAGLPVDLEVVRDGRSLGLTVKPTEGI